MFLLVSKKSKIVLLSSVQPLAPEQYSDQEVYILDIPDDQYTDSMVGGVIEHD